MFGFDWSEIALIGVVALVLIGPKDMPIAIKTISNLVKKARRMAADFQGQVDEMVRDTELHDVRNSLTELRSDLKGLNLRSQLAKTIDADGSLRRTMTENPLDTPPPFPPARHIDVTPETVIEAPAPATSIPNERASGSVSPNEMPAVPVAEAEATVAAAPAFIPPARGGTRAPVVGTVPRAG